MRAFVADKLQHSPVSNGEELLAAVLKATQFSKIQISSNLAPTSSVSGEKRNLLNVMPGTELTWKINCGLQNDDGN